MIHPHTELRFISEEIGYGVFATAFIPKGTITYVKDSLEIVVKPEEYQLHNADMQAVIEKYSYIDENGNRIVSWDFAKYVNHCCQCNSMSTGYGFEIAITDIQAGEQLTDEYGLFNLEYAMSIQCGKSGCRGLLQPKDFDENYQKWDQIILNALTHFNNIPQPLFPFLEPSTKDELSNFFNSKEKYKSVYALKYVKAESAEPKADNVI